METIIIEEKTMASASDPKVMKTIKLCQRGTNFYAMNAEGDMFYMPNVHDVKKAKECFKIYKPL